MPAVAIRKATVEDIPSIVEVCVTSATEEETKGFAAPEWVTYSDLEELRRVWETGNRPKDGSEVIVAEKAGKVVGFIVFGLERDCAYIDDIDITKCEQRKGIDRALVEYVEETARTNGYSCIKTDTTENAEGVPWKSYCFWIRMGFKDTGERLPTKWSFKTIPFAKEPK